MQELTLVMHSGSAVIVSTFIAWIVLFVLFSSTLIMGVTNYIVKIIKHYKTKHYNEKVFKKYNFKPKC